MDDLPLISCIMPTFNRQRFLPRALDMFFAQSYPRKELIVIDDGTDRETLDYMCRLPHWPHELRYRQLYTRTSVGTKRNLACELAQGSLIAHFDDDDWQHPHRLRNQLQQLETYDLTGLDSQLYYRPADGTAWRYTFWRNAGWYAVGNTFLYTRALWLRNRFRDISGCEDTQFLLDGQNAMRVNAVSDPHVVALLHADNSGVKTLAPPFWKPAASEELHALMGPAAMASFSSIR